MRSIVHRSEQGLFFVDGSHLYLLSKVRLDDDIVGVVRFLGSFKEDN